VSSMYLDDGTNVRVIDGGDNFATTLKPGVYEVNFNPMQGFSLRHAKAFSIPEKVYGNVPTMASRILMTFADRKQSTGVLLSGEKGSGKTLLAKYLSAKAMAQGVPTILVNQPFHGPQFNSFIQSIDQECIVLFDEFEKVYRDQEEKTGLLTLLDGVINTRKMYLMTCNDIYAIDSHMTNRPGRLYYAITFKGVGEEFILDYCNDRLWDKKWLNDVVTVSKKFSAFNFDMLQALVEEVNRFDEKPQDLMCMLNVCPAHEENETWKVVVLLDGKSITQLPYSFCHGGILREIEDDEYVYITYRYRDKEGKSKQAQDGFRADQLVSYDDSQLVFKFGNKGDESREHDQLDKEIVGDYKEAVLVLTKAQKKSFYPSYNMFGGA
jgi:hypothetical protein